MSLSKLHAQTTEFMKNLDRISLRTAMAIPFIYFGNVALSSLFYPGYSQLGQLEGQLGSKLAPHPELFNVGNIIMGAAILIAAFGFCRELQSVGTRPILNWLTTLVLALFGCSALMAGFFPWPDPRYGGSGLALIHICGPALLAAALWGRRETRLLNAYLIGTNLLMVAILAIMMGAGGLVTYANSGLIERMFALAGIPWIGIGAYVLKRITKVSDKSPRELLII